MNEHVSSGTEPDPTSSESHQETDDQLRGVIDEYMSTFQPEPEDTAGVRERILQLVRDDLYRGPSTHLQTEHGHPFAISTASVRSIVRNAVDSVDGIRARSVDVEPAGVPEGSAATVSLTVAMRAGISFASTADVIRRSVSAAILAELGIPAARIDINAEDVYVD
ncbi:hypothetical protein [Brevibacterium sp. 239c]|uniref:hypothetical protein n=1 Tax=Brevibacterium sp. 239c TaxID=1965356 RepID=UPI000C7914B5|nr:hypothetical protein [Brevibacterium sp. 239c]